MRLSSRPARSLPRLTDPPVSCAAHRVLDDPELLADNERLARVSHICTQTTTASAISFVVVFLAVSPSPWLLLCVVQPYGRILPSAG